MEVRARRGHTTALYLLEARRQRADLILVTLLALQRLLLGHLERLQVVADNAQLLLKLDDLAASATQCTGASSAYAQQQLKVSNGSRRTHGKNKYNQRRNERVYLR